MFTSFSSSGDVKSFTVNYYEGMVRHLKTVRLFFLFFNRKIQEEEREETEAIFRTMKLANPDEKSPVKIFDMPDWNKESRENQRSLFSEYTVVLKGNPDDPSDVLPDVESPQSIDGLCQAIDLDGPIFCIGEIQGFKTNFLRSTNDYQIIYPRRGNS